MLSVLIGMLFVLHGLVHMLYFAHSLRLFELQPQMAWPEGSWAFSRLLGARVTRLLASIACAVAAVGFVAGGLGVLMKGNWWRPAITSAAAFSAVTFVLFWDGKARQLDNQGLVAILINIAILAAVFLLRQHPELGF